MTLIHIVGIGAALKLDHAKMGALAPSISLHAAAMSTI